MNIEYKKFQELDIDTTPIGLSREDNIHYFCTPLNANVFGWDNGIHYCFIKDYGEMVFAVNPETLCNYYVYPIAENFHDFLRLLLAVKNTNVLQQIILWSKQQYIDFINSQDEIAYSSTPEVNSILEIIRLKFGIKEMQNPYEYVKNLQTAFDYSGIVFSDEYYNVTGNKKM